MAQKYTEEFVNGLISRVFNMQTGTFHKPEDREDILYILEDYECMQRARYNSNERCKELRKQLKHLQSKQRELRTENVTLSIANATLKNKVAAQEPAVAVV